MFRSKVLHGSALTLLAATLLACDRTPEARPRPPSPPPAATTTTSTAPASVSASGQAKPENFRLPSSARLVAIGDIHGDLKALRAALRLAGAINGEDDWVGKDLTVVQTGDQVDRGDQDREVLDVLEKLEGAAKAAGSALHVLNGNHELMNAAGDFRYVTPAGFTSFADFATKVDRAELARFSPLERGRAAAFSPGGPYALKLAERSTILMLGDTVFVHGGVTSEHVHYGVKRINNDVSRFMRGEIRQLPPILQSDDSPLWLRAYSQEPLSRGACTRLEQTLAELGARRMVVGHTVQPSGINSACSERVWRIDVGMARHYGGPRQVLEIQDKSVRVIAGTGPRD